MIPADNYDSDTRLLMSLPYQSSSRVTALEHNRSKSIGASCNVYEVQDNLESIAYGMAWGTSVLGYQGAPSWDLSNLRPAGSPLGSKGTASGAVSFGRVYDAIVGEMRREEKKNGAGVLGLDYRHPELKAFLSEQFKHAYRIVYLPQHDTEEAYELLADEAKVEFLAQSYNDFKCFLVKRPKPTKEGEPLFVNLCTEVEIPHKGYCVLGAFNFSYFNESNLHFLPAFFRQAMGHMVRVQKFSEEAGNNTEFLGCSSSANKQVGLGIYGLASVLGNLGVTYKEFNEALWYYGVDARHCLDIGGLVESVAVDTRVKTNAELFVSELIKGYYEASVVAKKADLRAAFCIQPTVSTSQRSLDYLGYNVSPEIQPVDGIKHEGGVNYLRKSAIKGDSVQVCSPNTWTIDEVPYETYALTSSLLQQLMDSTGLAHRHSHCFYGQEFTVENFKDFYFGELKYRQSLYYRLPFSNNTDSLRKDKLWQEVADGELFEGDLSALLGQQKKGLIECSCEG